MPKVKFLIPEFFIEQNLISDDLSFQANDGQWKEFYAEFDTQELIKEGLNNSHSDTHYDVNDKDDEQGVSMSWERRCSV